MKVVWDEPKRLANLAKHGLDFAHFEEGFDFDTAIQLPAHPSPTGRERFRLVGWLFDELVVVAVMSPLGTEALSIVSLRHAKETEGERHVEGS